MGRLFAELRRRKVFHVAGVYGVTAWLLAQAAALGESALGLPQWVDAGAILFLALGFPIALILAWAFEMTPEGVRQTAPSIAELTGTSTIDGGKLSYVLFGLFVISAGGLLYFLPDSGTVEVSIDDPSLPASSEFDISKTIAVLPLVNLSPDPDNAYFAAGIHEEILSRLSKIADLRVISRTSVMQYADTTKTLIEIGAELRAGAILEGSVRYAGNRVRITAQLINAADDTHLWAETYERDLTDIFAIQADVAERVAAALAAEMTADEQNRIDRVPTENMEAYNLFLKSRYRQEENPGVLTADREGWIQTGIRDMRRAIELDPDFALGHAELAFLLHKSRVVANFQLLTDQAIAEATKALEIDPTLSRAHDVLGLLAIIGQRWEEAERHFREAISYGAEARTYSNFSGLLGILGRFEEAHDMYRQALARDPSALTREMAIRLKFGEQDFEGALEEIDVYRMLGGSEIDYTGFRAFALYFMGREDEAADLALKWPQEGGSEYAREMMIFVLVRTGHETEAASVAYGTFGSFWYALAIGDYESALEIVEFLDSLNIGILDPITDPRFNEFRKDPRWVRMEEFYGLPAL